MTVLTGGRVLSATIHADILPAPRQGSEYAQSLSVCDRGVLQHASLPSPCGCSDVTDLDSIHVKSSPMSNDDVGQTCEAKAVPVLTDRHSSFDLGLLALLGLRLGRSAPWVKNLLFNCIPDWYGRCGPYQISHSLAVMQHCLSPAPVGSFIQQGCRLEDSMPQYGQKTRVSLRRRSDFTPAVLAPRGPPTCRREIVSLCIWRGSGLRIAIFMERRAGWCLMEG
jgi:hypothetical protein